MLQFFFFTRNISTAAGNQHCWMSWVIIVSSWETIRVFNMTSERLWNWLNGKSNTSSTLIVWSLGQCGVRNLYYLFAENWPNSLSILQEYNDHYQSVWYVFQHLCISTYLQLSIGNDGEGKPNMCGSSNSPRNGTHPAGLAISHCESANQLQLFNDSKALFCCNQSC